MIEVDASDNIPFLKRFYQALGERVLKPGDPFYEPIYADTDLSPVDPVARVQRGIEWAKGQSTQIFSGFRGTGKSTELQRLRAQLEAKGYQVAFFDIEKLINLSMPIDISEFLIVVAGALSEEAQRILGIDVAKEGYWTRFSSFLTRTEVTLGTIDVKGGTKAAGAQIKLGLKENPTFRKLLQFGLKEHVGALVDDVRAFVSEVSAAVAAQYDGAELVLILDSFEKIRGTSQNAAEVEAAVESIFQAHVQNLQFDGLHAVYSAPPWVKIKLGGVGTFNGSYLVPCLKVREVDGMPCQAGLDAAEGIVRRRGDWLRLLGDRGTLDRLVLASGGHLRDLFRLLESCLQQAADDVVPVSERVVNNALHEVRNAYLPISRQDAVWLDAVRRTHQPALDNNDRLHDLARFFYTHMVLCYRNGEEWYDVHPLIADYVETLAQTAPRAP